MIYVENLKFSYGSVAALRGVSFRISAGEICGYLGPNGAGKSTTVKSLVGILRPACGTIRICDQDIARSPLEAKRLIGYVPETAAAFSLLTVNEYLALAGELYEMPPPLLRQRTEKLIDTFGLAEAAHRCIETLSKGQRQKTVLAAALIHDPPVLILDEPLTGLDANGARAVKECLLGLAAEGRAILFCSHVLEVVERICGRVIVLHQGQIVADAGTRELLVPSRARGLEDVFQRLTMGEADHTARELLRALAVPGPGGKRAP
jgi:ABC-2 type transport system ATP-binding protein